MRAERIWHITKLAVGWGLIAAIVALVVFSPKVPPVEAQSGGSGTFTLVIQAPASGSTTYFAIPNRNQVASTIIMTGPSAHTVCGGMLDASTNNSNFFTLAAGTYNLFDEAFGQASTTFSANGWWPYYRVKVVPCTQPQTITVVGYGAALPLSPIVTDESKSFTSPVAIQVSALVPFTVTGFDCYNSNSSTAFVQLLFTPTAATPTLGGAYDFQDFAIAGNSVFSYRGSPFSAYSFSSSTQNPNFWAGAATAFEGSTAVTDAVVCNFQINNTGPFTPFNPPSN